MQFHHSQITHLESFNVMENNYCKYNAKKWLEYNEITEEHRKEMFPGITSAACSNIQGGISNSGNYDQVTYDNLV